MIRNRITFTERGFAQKIDMKDKYNQDYYFRQSSADMSDVWIGITSQLCSGSEVSKIEPAVILLTQNR